MAIEATILELRASGALVSLPDGRVAWLPARELFPHIRPHDDFRRMAARRLGQQIDVVEFPGVGTGRPLVSHVRATNDPWKHVARWREGEVKVMEVIGLTEDSAIGIISPGVRARIPLHGAGSMLTASWRGFDFPLPGDEVAGYFSPRHVNERTRIVTLDAERYVRGVVAVADALAVPGDSGEALLAEVQAAPSAPEGGPRRQPGIVNVGGRILIVDNDNDFLASLDRYLREELSCQTLPCNWYETARHLIRQPEGHCALALLDIHLENGNDFLGLDLAEDLAEHQPNCRIVLLSGDELDRAQLQVRQHTKLPVAGFVAKPLAIDDLLGALNHAAPVTSLGDFLSAARHNPRPTEPANHHSSFQSELEGAIETLCQTTGADAVALFSVDPVSCEVRIRAKSDPFNLVPPNCRDLDRSPVWNAAIGGETVLTNHASAPDDAGKHRYLRRKVEYESCIGVPVNVQRGTPLGHALFAFHRVPDAFVSTDRNATRLASTGIGFILRAEILSSELKQMKPFELMGKVYGSMAHDLRTALPDEVMLQSLLADIQNHDLLGAEKTAHSVRGRSERAIGIVETFRQMARGQHEQITDFPLAEAVAEAARTFAKSYRIPQSRCVVVADPGPPCLLRMRRSGLQQIIYNLLLNAVQQTGRLGPVRSVVEEIRVEVRRVTDADSRDWVLVLVHDNGPGIHRRDFERVFEILYTTKEDGCGMGLDICRSIAESVQRGERLGSVRVRRSVLLAGTTFELRLPI